MKNRFLFTGIALVLVVMGAAYFQYAKKRTVPASTAENQAPAAPTDIPGWKQASPPPASLSPADPQAEPQPLARNFILIADDNGVDPQMIAVKKGTPVNLVFRVKTLNVSKGITFKGGGLTTELIRPGQSGSLSLTATAPVTILPYSASGSPLKYDFRIAIE